MSPRTILLTGANGGLGQAIARAFLIESKDNFLYLGVHTNRQQAEDLATKFPLQTRIISLDVTQPEAWQEALKTIDSEPPGLEVLVNNAGYQQDGLLATMDTDIWHQVLAANLHSVFYGCRAALPLMIARRHGRIVNLASLSALLAPPGQTNYASAKAGVVALTQSLAKEVARIGITVNAVCPGYIQTEALGGMTPEERKAAESRVPMRRFGRPEEVAAAVRFLASSEAGYITGSILKVDGGIL